MYRLTDWFCELRFDLIVKVVVSKHANSAFLLFDTKHEILLIHFVFFLLESKMNMVKKNQMMLRE